MVLGSGLLAWPVALLARYKLKTFIPPMMFSNSGNMGLPLALFAFGEGAMEAAVVLFIVENTLHFSLGLKMMDWKSSIFRSLLRIPILLATLLGLAFNTLNLELPLVISTPIEMMGQIAIPLMLFALGVRLTAVDFRDWQIGLVGALVCPLAGISMALLINRLLELSSDQFRLLVIIRRTAAGGAQLHDRRKIPPGTRHGRFHRNAGQSGQCRDYPCYTDVRTLLIRLPDILMSVWTVPAAGAAAVALLL